MNKELRRVRERSALLVATAEAQRESLGRSVEVWRRPLTVLDHGLAAFRFVGSHPAWIIGNAIVPSLLRRERASSWFKRGLLAFQWVSKLRSARLEKGPAEPRG